MGDLVPVRISVASMWQQFNGCEPDYIRDVCHSRCCDAPSRPSGTMVTIHRTETDRIVARGGVVADGLLVTPDRRCTFKDGNHLCSLHHTPDKPFGCIASPFTLNKSDCLIVRNRYRSLICYRPHDGSRGEGLPAFQAFRASLDLIFGRDEAETMCNWLSRHGNEIVGWASPVTWSMPRESYDILKENDEVKKTHTASG
jgi:hypothetical protein